MAPILRRAACLVAAVLLFHAGAPLAAQDVTLQSRDGGLTLHGTMLGYDGEFYRVDTIYGELLLDAQGVVCSGPGCPNLSTYVAEFTIAGSAPIGGALMPALLAAYARERGYDLHARTPEAGDGHVFSLVDPDEGRTAARITVTLSTSDAGLVALMDGSADMALSYHPFSDEAVRSRVIALDGFVPVVAPSSDAESIALADLADVLAGEITDWSALRGTEAAINLHARDDAAGQQQALEAALLGQSGRSFATSAERHDSDAALLDAVGRDPHALAVTVFSRMEGVRALALAGACGLSQSASARAIKDEDYPLTVPLYLHYPARPLPLMARRFLEFLATDSAQAAVRRAGLVDQAPQTVPLAAQGRRLANAIAAAGDEVDLEDLQRMVTLMEGSSRLTITFRFKRGASRLDAQSRGNVDALARAIEAGRYDDRTLTLVGFTDGAGPADVNLRLASERAEAVRRAILAAAPFLDHRRAALETAAFGEAMPLACDDTEWGRRANRRVEVWLR
ncbi:cell envelope biogenesis protein OmpA [Rhodobacteraceae bacterium WD3A24]|nr:cell envelope biogenesis protein OmpA [Rhodobacteraceae bacterium WD3A24]